MFEEDLKALIKYDSVGATTHYVQNGLKLSQMTDLP